MALKLSVRRFILLSLVAITGLTLFHKYVEEQSTTSAATQATKEYVGAVRWVVNRMPR